MSCLQCDSWYQGQKSLCFSSFAIHAEGVQNFTLISIFQKWIGLVTLTGLRTGITTNLCTSPARSSGNLASSSRPKLGMRKKQQLFVEIFHPGLDYSY